MLVHFLLTTSTLFFPSAYYHLQDFKMNSEVVSVPQFIERSLAIYLQFRYVSENYTDRPSVTLIHQDLG